MGILVVMWVFMGFGYMIRIKKRTSLGKIIIRYYVFLFWWWWDLYWIQRVYFTVCYINIKTKRVKIWLCVHGWHKTTKREHHKKIYKEVFCYIYEKNKTNNIQSKNNCIIWRLFTWLCLFVFSDFVWYFFRIIIYIYISFIINLVLVQNDSQYEIMI